MLSCQEATRLASERQDRPLGASQRLGLWLHLMMCRHCSAFVRQLRLIKVAWRRHTEQGLPSGGPELPEEARRRIEKALEEQQSKSAPPGPDAGTLKRP